MMVTNKLAEMSPSSSSSSICCCSRYFRRSREQPATATASSERRPIEIKVNGLTQLRVPNVALCAPIAQAPPPLAQAPPTSARSDSDGDVFETARTSRHTPDGKLHKMTELMRMIRIEEGLEVTPRVEKNEDSSANPISIFSSQITRPPAKRPKRAVFNDDGDITTRSVKSEEIQVFSLVPPERRISSSSIIVPSLQEVPRIVAKPSSFTRRIASAPQIVTAFVAFSYACLTMMLTSFSNLFARRK